MADLNELQAAQTIKIVGSSSAGVEQTAIGSTANGDLHVADGLRSGGTQGSLTLTTGGTAYEAKVGVSALTNRKLLTITANDDMFWGYNNTVTISTGTPLKKDQQIVFSINPNDSSFAVWLVASTNNKTARITECP